MMGLYFERGQGAHSKIWELKGSKGSDFTKVYKLIVWIWINNNQPGNAIERISCFTISSKKKIKYQEINYRRNVENIYTEKF